MNLLNILLILFITLTVVVMVAERYGKPMDNAKQAKFSRIAIVLVAILLVTRLINELL